MDQKEDEHQAKCHECGTAYSPKRRDQCFCSVRCRKREAARKWHNSHREQRNLERMNRYHASKTEILEKRRLDRSKNKEKYKKIDKRNYEKNKDAILKRMKIRRELNKEKISNNKKSSYKEYKSSCPWRFLLRSAKRRSQKKNIAYTLSNSWALKNWTGFCSVTGIQFSSAKSGNATSGSIDRINPKEGYTEENCRFVLFSFNSIKGTGTDEVAIETIIKMADSLRRQRPRSR